MKQGRTISSRHPWDKRTSCWYYWLELNKNKFFNRSISAFQPKNKTKQKNRIPKASLKPILSYDQPFIRTHLNTTPRRFPQKQLPRVRSLKQAVELKAFQWPQQQRQLERLWWRHSDPRWGLAWVHGTWRSPWENPNQKEGAGVRRNFNQKQKRRETCWLWNLNWSKAPSFLGWHLFGWFVFQSSRQGWP